MCDHSESMKNSKDNSEILHLTTQQLTGEASREELSRLEELLAESDGNQQLHSELVSTWAGTEKATGISLADTDIEWLRLKTVMQKEVATKSSFSFFKIAATIILAVGVGLSIYFLSGDGETRFVAQKIQTELLADGSSITLNKSAELSFSPGYGELNREVNLVGEAYFDIERDPEKPFIIHAASLDVKVLGTSFTVRALQDESTVEVVVTDGTVELTYQGKKVTLEIGEKGILDKKSGQLFKVFNDDANFMAWKTKVFVFDDVPLEYVIEILNNAYQSSLFLKGTEITNCPVTVTFEKKSLSSILQILTATLNLSIRETSNGNELSGNGC